MNVLEESINDLVNDLLDERGELAENEKIFNHPDKEVIIDILASLRKIIFPGYFKNRDIKVFTLRNNLSMLLEDVVFKLTKQITIVLGEEGSDEEDILAIAREKALAFIKRIKTIREYILTDVQAAYDGDPAAYSSDEDD